LGHQKKKLEVSRNKLGGENDYQNRVGKSKGKKLTKKVLRKEKNVFPQPTFQRYRSTFVNRGERGKRLTGGGKKNKGIIFFSLYVRSTMRSLQARKKGGEKNPVRWSGADCCRRYRKKSTRQLLENFGRGGAQHRV